MGGQLAQFGDELGPYPPDNVAAGQTGHIAAHNELAQLIAVFAQLAAAMPAFSWGSVTLTGGRATVAAGVVGPGSLIYLSRQAPVGTLGELGVGSINPGVSFTIVSASSGDNSAVAYLIIP